MHVRGAPLIGAVGAFGLVFAANAGNPQGDFDAYLVAEAIRIKDARPTAVNLEWAVDRVLSKMQQGSTIEDKQNLALEVARKIVAEELERCRLIGEHGLALIRKIADERNGQPVRVLTHCNAGWLACVDYGTATAPVYLAHDEGINIHVWVDETRPWNQGSRLTAYELGKHGVPHSVITDNAGGLLMSRGEVDLVIVGTDRTTKTGDVANKIGTYLKALAAKDNDVPFYVALPSSTIDWELSDGADIPIEERDSNEIHFVQGALNGEVVQVRITPEGSPASNYSFDITPARLVTGFITERGVCGASEKEFLRLFPEGGESGV
jgi:methylthioribose-1-phosphate isomerase